MALVFSGGTLVDNSFNLGTSTKKLALYQGIETALTAAGWTMTAGLPEQRAIIDNTTTKKPVDADTIIVIGKTYTFKAVLNHSNDGEVLIGVDGVTTYANLIACMNMAAGAGTLYSTATTAGDGTVTEYALNGETTDYFIWTANLIGSAGGAVSESTSYFVWNDPLLSMESFIAETVETPDYLRGAIKFVYNGEALFPWWSVMNRDYSASTVFADTQHFDYADNADQRILASKFGFWMVRPSSTDHANHFGFNVFSIPEPMRCKKITAATNASPIAITTNVAHTYVTGQQVKQLYVEGNLAANGTFTITVTGPTTYTCDGSTGTGAMTGDLGVAANVSGGYNEIMEFHQADSSIKIASGGTFRVTTDQRGEHPGFFNGVLYQQEIEWTALSATVVEEDFVVYPWFNGAVVFDSPVNAFSADNGATWRLAGQYYNVGILRQNTPMDTSITDADGNNWLSLTDTAAEGTFVVLVS